MRSVLIVATCAALFSCGGPQSKSPSWPSNASVHVTVIRDDVHPTYRCEGQIQTYFTTASFSCTAEGFDAWDVRGYAEQFVLSDVLRFWIHDGGAAGTTALGDDHPSRRDVLRAPRRHRRGVDRDTVKRSSSAMWVATRGSNGRSWNWYREWNRRGAWVASPRLS